jgi:ABC-2 type transport system permease protein
MTANYPRMLWMQFRAELVKFWRVPANAFFSLALPLIIFIFFGLRNPTSPYAPGTTVSTGAFVMASMAAYTVGSVMVFSFGIGVAVERGQKQDVLLRASPLPPAIYLVAKVMNALVFSLFAMILLFVFAHFAASVNLSAIDWITLAGRLLLGSLAFIMLGFALGYLAGPSSAPAVVNLIYLPVAFGSGIFIPTQFLPDFIRGLSPYLPLSPFAQLAWSVLGIKTDRSVEANLLLLGAYAIVFFALAVWAYRRDTSLKFT